MRKVLVLAAALPAATIGLAGCGSSASSGPSPTVPAATSSTTHTTRTPTSMAPSGTGTTPAAATAMITIKNFKYQVSGPVQPGEKVTVKNNDNVSHTVTADQSKSLFDVTVEPGHTMTFTAPTKAGTYKFHCNFHANMHGTLVVK